MSTRELAGRVEDQVRRSAWSRGRAPLVPAVAHPAPLATPLPPFAAAGIPAGACADLVEVAEELLDGRWEVFGVVRHDMAAPDWFRSESRTGNVKQVWELSRHHHLTVLAAAWLVTADDRYAEAVDRQLRSWWRDNPFLSGVHWTSGIELGIRLVAWAWIRRLLDGWPGVTDLFEGNEEAVRQLYWHQRYLAAFPSRGSSANNHVIAEAAGRLVGACAFGWFPESDRWRSDAAGLLERELALNTFPSGLNRELASDYHCFVAELGLVAAVEAEAAGHPLGDGTWALLGRMVDAAAAVVDERLMPPRQGDGDEGRALLLDAPGTGGWGSLLAAGAGVFGALPWWPAAPSPDVRSTLLVALLGKGGKKVAVRPGHRSSHFPDAGLTILRSGADPETEIWCRCDAGPHGYLSIAAHAHADALSIEVRRGGVEVLADPGTYCYHGEPEWRSYFRSTVAHNTLEIGGEDQTRAAGPFMWASAATATGTYLADGMLRWSAEHDGYRRLDPPATHRRTVSLDPERRRLEIRDRIISDGRHRCRLAFHFGPSVEVVVAESDAFLTWPGGTGSLLLSPGLEWALHRGETGPTLGWYSPGFGRKTPAVSLIGSGALGSVDGDIVTIVDFGD